MELLKISSTHMSKSTWVWMSNPFHTHPNAGIKDISIIWIGPCGLSSWIHHNGRVIHSHPWSSVPLILHYATMVWTQAWTQIDKNGELEHIVWLGLISRNKVVYGVFTILIRGVQWSSNNPYFYILMYLRFNEFKFGIIYSIYRVYDIILHFNHAPL